MTETTKTQTYTGGCHCGAVRYEVELDLHAGLGRCNCSICHKLGRTGAIVKPGAFRLLAGEPELTEYRFGHGVGRYVFCKRCGIHSFGSGELEQLGGAYVSINVNCLDDVDPVGLPTHYWDGRHDNWMAGPRETPWPIGVSPDAA